MLLYFSILDLVINIFNCIHEVLVINYNEFENDLITRLLFISFLVLLAGCSDHERDNFSPEYICYRKAIEIPNMEKYKTHSFATESIMRWESNTNDIDFVRKHIAKIISLEDGVRVSEEDDFYKRLNNTITQLISIKYSFENTTEP